MERKSILGVWSFVGTVGLFVWLSVKFGTLETSCQDLWNLVTGGVMQIPQARGDYLGLVRAIFALVVIDLALSFSSLFLIVACTGSTGKHKVKDLLMPPQGAKLFKMFFWLVVFEELFARLLFLGALTSIPGLGGTFGFYLLFLVGNLVWAWVHILNFEKKDRDIIRVVPQFLGGIVFTYAYWKWGLTGAILTHFATNAVLFSLAKEQRFNVVDLATLLITAALGAAGYFFMRRPTVEAFAWFEASKSFVLEGWTFRDYFCLFLFFTMSLAALAELLAYDKSNLREVEKENKTQAPVVAVGAILTVISALVVCLWRLGNWLLKLVARKALTRAGILGVGMCFAHESRSANAVARSFWVGIPSGAMMVAITIALPFWQACGFFLLAIGVELPLLLLKKIDD